MTSQTNLIEVDELDNFDEDPNYDGSWIHAEDVKATLSEYIDSVAKQETFSEILRFQQFRNELRPHPQYPEVTCGEMIDLISARWETLHVKSN